VKLFNFIEDLDLDGKRVLVRADLNVPIQNGKILDATRLNRIVPTLTDLLSRGAKIILMSHLGRPEGRIVPELSLKPIRFALEKILRRPVMLTNDCIGQNTVAQIKSMPRDTVAILENLRFHLGEQANDRKFSQELAKLGDIYINDAFSCAHRAHASTEGIAQILPAAVGRLMQLELTALNTALENPEHPVGAIVGGAKISTKLSVLGNLVNKVDKLIIGGAMANTFLLAEGFSVGSSLCEKNMLSEVHEILAEAHR
jgi:phosphoglycerate kinase